MVEAREHGDLARERDEIANANKRAWAEPDPSRDDRDPYGTRAAEDAESDDVGAALLKAQKALEEARKARDDAEAKPATDRPGEASPTGSAPTRELETNAPRESLQERDRATPRMRRGKMSNLADEGTAPRARKVRARTRWEWIVFCFGILAHVLVDVILLFSPSIRGRKRRYGGLDDPPPKQKSREPLAGQSVPTGVDAPKARRGTAGARQRARDRADVPAELRGKISAERWRKELKAYHEEQVQLAAAREQVMGEVAADTAAVMKKRARAKAAANVGKNLGRFR